MGSHEYTPMPYSEPTLMVDLYPLSAPSQIEMLWQDPEFCIMCKDRQVTQYCVFESPEGTPKKILRLCSQHAMGLLIRPDGMTDRRTVNGLLSITPAELADLQCRGAYIVIDSTGSEAGLSHEFIKGWKKTCTQMGKCYLHLYKFSYGWKVAWNPSLPEMERKRGITKTRKEQERERHAQRLYSELSRLRPWAKNPRAAAQESAINRSTMMLETPIIDSESDALEFLNEVLRIEGIIRDPALLACSLVMDT